MDIIAIHNAKTHFPEIFIIYIFIKIEVSQILYCWFFTRISQARICFFTWLRAYRLVNNISSQSTSGTLIDPGHAICTGHYVIDSNGSWMQSWMYTLMGTCSIEYKCQEFTKPAIKIKRMKRLSLFWISSNLSWWTIYMIIKKEIYSNINYYITKMKS